MAANLYKCLLLLRCPIKEGAGQKRHLNATFAAIMTIAKGPLSPVVLFFSVSFLRCGCIFYLLITEFTQPKGTVHLFCSDCHSLF